jgi:hypothetical protein
MFEGGFILFSGNKRLNSRLENDRGELCDYVLLFKIKLCAANLVNTHDYIETCFILIAISSDLASGRRNLLYKSKVHEQLSFLTNQTPQIAKLRQPICKLDKYSF